MSGIDPGEFDLTFGRQELIEQIVVVKKEDLDTLEDFELPNTDRTHRYYLRSTPIVQSEHRAISRQASRIRGINPSARDFAEELVNWVYNYLEKVPTAGVPSAVEVLNRRAGDCNEHTVLYTALARAAGLPTLMNAGVVYLDGQFYYHAWPSVWLGSFPHYIRYQRMHSCSCEKHCWIVFRNKRFSRNLHMIFAEEKIYIFSFEFFACHSL